jgi:glycine/D-amino acid oxidase-like deaminating enzyme
MNSVTETDVVIIGAGITGICTALELLQQGRRVLIVERREAGAGASGNNAGSCALQNKVQALVPLAREGIQIWQSLNKNLGEEGLELGYARSGGLRIALSAEEADQLERTAEAQNALGLPVVFLSGDKAKSIAPYLGEAVVAANWCPEDGFCDVLQAMASLLTAVRRRGGTIWTYTEVTSIEPVNSGLLVHTTRGSINTARAVVSTGIWTRDLPGVLSPLVHLRVHISVLSVTRPAAQMMEHMITHARNRLTMKQLKVGTVVIGGGWPGTGDYHTYRVWPTFESLMSNWSLAVQAMPRLRDLPILRSWASVEGRSPDEMPLIGPVPGLKGLYIAACCPGGWTIGPYMARMVAEMIDTNRIPDAVSQFSVGRFSGART